MIELLSSIVEFIMDIIGLAFTIAIDAVELVFGVLGGLLSLLFTVGGIILAVVLVRIFIKRRRTRKPEQKIYIDQDGEEFVSFYDQQR